MSLNLAQKQQAYSQSGEGPIPLLAFNHPDLPGGVLRVAKSQVDIVSNGDTYQGASIRYVPPERTSTTHSKGRIAISFIPADLLHILLGSSVAPTVDALYVMESDPDTVFTTSSGLRWSAFVADAIEMTGSLTHAQFYDQNGVRYRFDPDLFPNLF